MAGGISAIPVDLEGDLILLEKKETNKTCRKARRRTMLRVVANRSMRLDGEKGKYPGPRNLAEIGAVYEN